MAAKPPIASSRELSKISHDEMMQNDPAGRPDVHSGTFSHRFQPSKTWMAEALCRRIFGRFLTLFI